MLISLRECYMMYTDANRHSVLTQVEGANSSIIGTVCAALVSAVFALLVILDIASIRESLHLLRHNLRKS